MRRWWRGLYWRWKGIPIAMLACVAWVAFGGARTIGVYIALFAPTALYIAFSVGLTCGFQDGLKASRRIDEKVQAHLDPEDQPFGPVRRREAHWN